jgi:Fe-Mn family superoxide dismutase
MDYQFKDLPYDFNALEPYIDARTMELHYTKHHRGYYDKFLAAIKGTDLEGKSLEDIFKTISTAPAAVRNNGGGYFNHTLFWEVMGPNGGGNPSGELAEAINMSFGSFNSFKDEFSNAAATRFGSGWAWLILNFEKKLVISSTPNQDNPLMDVTDSKGIPIFGLDVWEHAYYLKYQNRRPDYIAAFWNVVNWNAVERNYNEGLKNL